MRLGADKKDPQLPFVGRLSPATSFKRGNAFRVKKTSRGSADN